MLLAKTYLMKKCIITRPTYALTLVETLECSDGIAYT